MAWFGETIGGSLNSLKGQITKITKEVLANDEAICSDKHAHENPSIKELEALGRAKDLEIASLRDELCKLHKQYQAQTEYLKSTNDIKTKNSTCDENNILIQKLENELMELRQERDHLNSCLDELQSEHQINLKQVISLTEKYKLELEKLTKEHNAIKKQLDDSLSKAYASDVNQGIDIELHNLKSQISELQLQLEKEKKKSENAVQKELESQNHLRGEIKKLLSEVQEMYKVKEKIEEDGRIFQIENEELKNKLIFYEKNCKETEVKLKLLINEKEDLLKKCQAQEYAVSKLSHLTSSFADVQQKMENLLQVLNINEGNENDINQMITLLENKFHEKCSESNKNWKESILDLELELKNLREENKNVQEKLKISMEKESEIERKHQEEILSLKSSLSEIRNQKQDCQNQSQTDDVKRLEQEIAQCMNLVLVKDKELTDYSKLLNKSELELKNLKESSFKIEQELETAKMEKLKLQEELEHLRNFNFKVNQRKSELERQQKSVEIELISLKQINCQLKTRINELEKQVTELKSYSEELQIMQKELDKVIQSKTELEKSLVELQTINFDLKNNIEHLKAQGIVKESNMAELMKANAHFQSKVAELQAQCDVLINVEKEKEKWKDTSINLQIQMEDLMEKKGEIENECLRLKSELQVLEAKETEIQQLKLTNSNLMKSSNELHYQLEIKAQEEQSCMEKKNKLDEECKNQSLLISQLQEENNELKCRIQKFQQELKFHMFHSKSALAPKEYIQQHRRSKSATETGSLIVFDIQESGTQYKEELVLLKQALQQEKAKYQLLQQQFQEICSEEASARKEFERLKEHLIEVEDHYTEETVENEKVINDLKSKLAAAEKQLQNSSTLYTSLKVRDNQHLESLQSQIRMVSAQRDDFQNKLSLAEDEVQKHKASLMSLQIVLEQFQQDKERELEQVAVKYEKKLQLTDTRYRDLESEIDGLKKQLSEAKNGLKAASRLGEQLEKKALQVSELEENQNLFRSKISELEQSLAVANQTNSGKVDKSLIKNLVIGYVLSPNAERKSQVLRIMAFVLDFDQEERDKIGVDVSRSGWLTNILHPKGEGPTSGQSLSEAFIKFLENESRPQPQLKLIPEQIKPNVSRTSRISPSGHLSELTLPTFNSSQENDSSIILKNVLRDS